MGISIIFDGNELVDTLVIGRGDQTKPRSRFSLVSKSA